MTRFFGLLHVRVIEGSNVAHSYAAYRRRTTHASCYRKLVCGADVRKCGGADTCGGNPDPYCVVALEVGGGRSYRLGRTRSITKNPNPRWDDEFTTLVDVTEHDDIFPDDFFASETGPALMVTIFDDDMAGPYNDDLMCRVSLPLSEVVKNAKPLQATLDLRHPKAKQESHSLASVRMEFRWFPIGAGAAPTALGPSDPAEPAKGVTVPNAYFKRCHGNLVTLYHDAECLPGDFPNISQPGSPHSYEAASCWKDISDAINQAEHFCLFTGWSINTATRLTRSYSGEDHPETIGELLRRRAAEGVRVIVMIWDDVTSTSGPAFLKGGVMGTYDEYTREFFQDTKVSVVMAARIASDDVGTMLYPFVGVLKGTSFTHHQKIVCCDVANPNNPERRRVLCAFVGGLDLTSGRYDTSRHELFDTLQTAHYEDFYNGMILDATAEGGPREPWHDIHSRIIGPAAYDVMQTFTERLHKQAIDVYQEFTRFVDTLQSDGKLRDGRAVLVHPGDANSWDVQCFRSLDTEAAVFANSKWCSRFGASKIMVDRSIHQAYLHLIDRAKSTIYIENQYFLGSAQYWLENTEVPCWHLIPYEITRRICRAIHEGRQFCVYVLIPLFPEGAPSSMTVQEILCWQFQTVRMMYARIGKKLQEVCNTTNHPTDYLQFFFPGKREPDALVQEPPKASAELSAALHARRLPIYVHSKMMIVDDEYIILGSANINERSMAGCRDTEVAVGCCQPCFTASYNDTGAAVLPKGDVAAFRLQLWHEHLGSIHPAMEDPASLSCSQLVRERAFENWRAFSGTENVELPYGHLCAYPYLVQKDGSCEAIPGAENIPGTQALVCGIASAILPSALTT